MKNTLPGRVRFGAYQLDLQAGELHKDDRRIRLQEQPFQVLQMLVERSGLVVSREEIQHKLWPNDTVVEFDHGINTAIKKLRNALNDSADKPKYIETVARRGYRLLVPVEWPSASSDTDPSNAEVSIGGKEKEEEGRSEPASLIGKIVSHYRVLNVIGGGGMGVVYRAEDLKLGRAVAVKFLPEELGNDPVALGRFTREARTASTLNHPNICTIYEIEEHEGHPFIVMEYMEGHTLRDLITFASVSSPLDKTKKITLPLEKVLEISIQIAEGLEAAHEKGIIHRDIKPANIFVTKGGQVKILDFGLAKLVHVARETASEVLSQQDEDTAPIGATSRWEIDSNLTRAGTSIGTAGYMSPEQIEGIKLDARTDLFCFGLVLYEMVSGRRAFVGGSREGLRDAILHQAPIPAHELNPAVPPKLEAIVNKCLEKDREQRYQHASEITKELKQLRREMGSGVLERKAVADRIAQAEKLASQAAPEAAAAPAPATVPVPQPLEKRSWLRIAAVIAVLLALGAGIFYWHSRRAATLTEKDTVVLADFINNSGEAVWDESLKQRLANSLEQSPYLNVLSDQTVGETLKLMKWPANQRLTLEAARDVCLRNSSKAVLAGTITRLGNVYEIDLRATNCQTGEQLAGASEQAKSQEDVFSALAKGSNQLRRQLGESLASVQKYDTPLPPATTASLEAIQAYAMGLKVKATQGPEAAVPFFNRAVELDPEFGEAYAALGAIYSDMGRSTLAMQNTKKAYEFRDRVSQRERYHIEGNYYDFVTGELEKANKTFQEWIQVYPGDWRPRQNLGANYSELGQYEKAVQEELATLKLSPETVDALTALMADYNAINQPAKAKATSDEARLHKLDRPELHLYRYLTAFLQGEDAVMQGEAASAMGDPTTRGLLLAAQSDTEAYHGRMESAKSFSQRAVQSAKLADLPEMAAVWKATEALRQSEVGNSAQARAMATEAQAMGSGRDVEILVALTKARTGDTAGAQELVDKIDREFPQSTMVQNYALPTIRAAIELQKASPDKAIEVLLSTVPYEMGGNQSLEYLYPAYLRGEAYLRSGQGQKAAAEYSKILDHPGITLNFVIGALTHLQLARAEAMSGDHAAARKSYQDFLSLWNQADPDIPILEAAKTEYQRLN